MMDTTATLTTGQRFTVVVVGHKFEGRALVVERVGSTGATLMAIDAVKGNRVFLRRDDTAVSVEA